MTSGGMIETPEFVPFYAVDAEYFRALGSSVLFGRSFAANDVAGQPQVAIVSTSLARLLESGGGGNAVGQDIYTLLGFATVIGVVEDRIYDPRTRETMALFLPKEQHQFAVPTGEAALTNLDIVVQTQDAELVKSVVVRSARDLVAPGISPTYLATAGEELRAIFALQHFASRTMVAFSWVSLLLVVLSMHVLLVATIRMKTGDAVIRSALGATRGAILWWFIKDIGRPLGVGVATGVAALSMWYRMMEGVVRVSSPWEFAIALFFVLMLLFASVIAVARPLWRLGGALPYELLRRDS